MVAGVGDGVGVLVHWTGVMATGLGGWFLGICVEGTMVTLGGNAVGLIFGNLGEVAGQSVWNTTAGEGRGALIAGAVEGLAVTLEKMWESVWMAVNLLLPIIANGFGVGCKRASAIAQEVMVTALVELPDGMGQS